MTEIINFAQGFFVGLIAFYLIARRQRLERERRAPAIPTEAPCVHAFGKWQLSAGQSVQSRQCLTCGWTIDRSVGQL